MNVTLELFKEETETLNRRNRCCTFRVTRTEGPIYTPLLLYVYVSSGP